MQQAYATRCAFIPFYFGTELSEKTFSLRAPIGLSVVVKVAPHCIRRFVSIRIWSSEKKAVCSLEYRELVHSYVRRMPATCHCMCILAG